jgi:nucleoside-triphosphatase
VDIEAFEKIAQREIEEAINHKKLLIVDEIGKMELYSDRFRFLILAAFNSEIPIVATILEKPHQFADKLKILDDVELIQLKRDNSQQTLNDILAKLG